MLACATVGLCVQRSFNSIAPLTVRFLLLAFYVEHILKTNLRWRWQGSWQWKWNFFFLWKMLYDILNFLFATSIVYPGPSLRSVCRCRYKESLEGQSSNKQQVAFVRKRKFHDSWYYYDFSQRLKCATISVIVFACHGTTFCNMPTTFSYRYFPSAQLIFVQILRYRLQFAETVLLPFLGFLCPRRARNYSIQYLAQQRL